MDTWTKANAGEWRPGFRTAWQPTNRIERPYRAPTGRELTLIARTVVQAYQNGAPEFVPYVWNRGEAERRIALERRLEAVRCWAGWRALCDD